MNRMTLKDSIGSIPLALWDEAQKAPESAPEVDKDLTEDQARDAVAVWVNDSKQLVLLKEVTKTPLR